VSKIDKEEAQEIIDEGLDKFLEREGVEGIIISMIYKEDNEDEDVEADENIYMLSGKDTTDKHCKATAILLANDESWSLTDEDIEQEDEEIFGHDKYAEDEKPGYIR
jgi:hypothetical protein